MDGEYGRKIMKVAASVSTNRHVDRTLTCTLKKPGHNRIGRRKKNGAP